MVVGRLVDVLRQSVLAVGPFVVAPLVLALVRIELPGGVEHVGTACRRDGTGMVVVNRIWMVRESLTGSDAVDVIANT